MTEVNGSAANVGSTRNVSRSGGELSQLLLLVITLPLVATRRYHYNVSVTVTHRHTHSFNDISRTTLGIRHRCRYTLIKFEISFVRFK